LSFYGRQNTNEATIGNNAQEDYCPKKLTVHQDGFTVENQQLVYFFPKKEVRRDISKRN
jgi:hypothetical protein